MVFLERQSYRRRRLIDLVRVLPLVGMFLWALPLFWGGDTPNEISTSAAMIYVFAVWFVLSICAAILAQFVRRSRADEITE